MYYIKVINYYYTSLIAFACVSKFGSNLLITSFNPILIFRWLEKYFEYWNIGFKKYVADSCPIGVSADLCPAGAP